MKFTATAFLVATTLATTSPTPSVPNDVVHLANLRLALTSYYQRYPAQSPAPSRERLLQIVATMPAFFFASGGSVTEKLQIAQALASSFYDVTTAQTPFIEFANAVPTLISNKQTATQFGNVLANAWQDAIKGAKSSLQKSKPELVQHVPSSDSLSVVHELFRSATVFKGNRRINTKAQADAANTEMQAAFARFKAGILREKLSLAKRDPITLFAMMFIVLLILPILL